MGLFHNVDLSIAALPGFYHFFGAWIYKGTWGNAVIDPGPTTTLHHLFAALNQLEITELHYVLLTHIHIDHAGGTGTLLKTFPNAKVVVHQRAHEHLIDPTRLIAGSRQVTPDLMTHYGAIEPVAQAALLTPDKGPCDIVDTPGHSPHHISFLIDDSLLCGEALGVTYPEAVKGGFYLRPATPPRFIPEVYLASIERISKALFTRLRFAHYGSPEPHAAEHSPEKYIDAARNQIQLWMNNIASTTTLTEDEVITHLVTIDPLLQPIKTLPADVQQREIRFTKNTIRGIRQASGHSQ